VTLVGPEVLELLTERDDTGASGLESGADDD